MLIKEQCKKMEVHSNHENRQFLKNENKHIKEFQPLLKVIKDKQGQVLTKNDQILGSWQEYCSHMYRAPQNQDASKPEEHKNMFVCLLVKTSH